MLPSKVIPRFVDNVRPADIKAIGAMGDSLLLSPFPEIFKHTTLHAANSLITGANGSLETHVTLFNVLRVLNSGVIGGSFAYDAADKGFHVARTAANSSDLERQILHSATEFKFNVEFALTELKNNLKRAIVSIIGVRHPQFLVPVTEDQEM
ncbi:hypothetical protein NECAME_09847 [Necator americanus]|uniref:Uncharacterized protein n=1 Tax=Necator americanus TaxID=51031 RepID=W2TCT8_NECAM|nr:hypothetical protein NECAME_09847 [Necator americanus]ETN79409.1 hypothetical protein NECAME_09847 [Necator americanus]